MGRTAALGLCLAISVSGCALGAKEADLVPSTVVDDPSLPRLSLTVAGRSRLIHYRSYGDSSAHVFLVAHGSLSDMRAYLPFASFADKYRVVLWDMRGSGLSERVSRDELAVEDMVEEIHQMKLRFSPAAPVVVLGHSWSAIFVARYLAEHPDEVSSAILMEPFGLKDSYMADLPAIVNLTRTGYLDMSWSSSSISPLDHERLDFRMLGMLTSGVRNFFKDPDNPPPWPVWRVGGLALLTWEASILNSAGAYSYDFTQGLGDYEGRVLLVGSQYSPIGYAFQERRHLPLFRNASCLRIEDSGHRMITEQWAALEGGVRAFLEGGI